MGEREANGKGGREGSEIKGSGGDGEGGEERERRETESYLERKGGMEGRLEGRWAE